MRNKYRSKFEKYIAKLLRRARVNFKYEEEKIPYVLACHYKTDWTLYTKTGKIYVETKGYLDAADKRKLIAVKKQHPEMDLRIVFQRATKENIRWAERNGFRYAIGSIPNEWLLGL